MKEGLEMVKEAFADWVDACRRYWTAEKDVHDLGPKLALHVVAIPFAVTVLAVFVSRMAFGSVLTTLMTASALAVVWFRYGGAEKERRNGSDSGGDRLHVLCGKKPGDETSDKNDLLKEDNKEGPSSSSSSSFTSLMAKLKSELQTTDHLRIFLNRLLVYGSADERKHLSDWMARYRAGNRNLGVSVEHEGVVLELQPSVINDRTSHKLKFKVSGKGRKDVTGEYDFHDLQNYIVAVLNEDDEDKED